MLQWAVLPSILLGIGYAYLRLADKLNIIDKPNERSSHHTPVVRGGGILFPLAWLIFVAMNGWIYPWFTGGLFMLSAISFWDDMRPLSAGQRFIFHLIACGLCFTELSLWHSIPVWGLICLFICCIGTLNAFNFMDGINGITGMYALSFLGILATKLAGPDDFFRIEPLSTPVLTMGISVIVFGFFNFRKKARCFAGDVGSISMGYILLFLLLSLMFGRSTVVGPALTTGQPGSVDLGYILMFSVYGVDSVLTILYRLSLRENIFEAHRKHLYQYLANERGMPHLMVSLTYAVVQSAINLYVLSGPVSLWGAFTILGSLSLVYVIIKYAAGSKKSV